MPFEPAAPSSAKLTVLGNTGRYLAPLAAGTSYLLEHGGTKVLLDADGDGPRPASTPASSGSMPSGSRTSIATMRSPTPACMVSWTPARGRGSPGVSSIASMRWPRPSSGGAHGASTAPSSRPKKGRRFASAPCRSRSRARSTARPRSPPASRPKGAPSSTRATPLPATGSGTSRAGRDLLLMHTLLPTVELESHHARVHATAQTAGALAAQVGAKRLLLSHRYHESGDGAMREAAGKGLPGVELAREGETLNV